MKTRVLTPFGVLYVLCIALFTSGQSGCPEGQDASPPLREDLRVASSSPNPQAAVLERVTPEPVRKEVRVREEPPFSMKILRLQVALDRKHFSPGSLDGKMNPLFAAAIRAFRASQGLSDSEAIDAEFLNALGHPGPILETYRVRPEDHAALTPLPRTWPERAEMARLGYETVLELVAEKKHATEALIRALNPDVDWPNPAPGTELQVPRVRVTPREPAKRLAIRLDEKTIQAFSENGTLIAHFPCSIAEKEEKRPRGRTRIKNAADNPNYTFDPDLFTELTEEERGTRRRLIPPGPNNPVGVAWMGFDIPSFGIHGTPDPENIGLTGSHGCFRVANWNAEKLMKMIRIGTPVEIQ